MRQKARPSHAVGSGDLPSACTSVSFSLEHLHHNTTKTLKPNTYHLKPSLQGPDCKHPQKGYFGVANNFVNNRVSHSRAMQAR